MDILKHDLDCICSYCEEAVAEFSGRFTSYMTENDQPKEKPLDNLDPIPGSDHDILRKIVFAVKEVDAVKEKPILERKREWAHNDQGPNKDCWRVDKPVYTEPEKAPDECHSCPSDEWFSKGIVTRDKSTKQIVDKERDRTVKKGMSEIVRSARRW